MAAIIDPNETAAARHMALTEIEKTVAMFGRRAKSPADKVAYAELQQELMEIGQRWAERGLLAEAQSEPVAA